MVSRITRTVTLAASPEAVFAHLDDQTRLGEHMEKPSGMMGGGRMTYEFDAGRGQSVGSHIKMGGSAFGLSLFVDEVVTERTPPFSKAWRTDGEVRLIIMRGYTMGFDITAVNGGARLSVWIVYDLPHGSFGWLAWPLAALYARWCVSRMASDAKRHFTPAPFEQPAQLRPS